MLVLAALAFAWSIGAHTTGACMGIAYGSGTVTSMNRALVGGLAGAGLARGQRTIHWPVLRAILVGWGSARCPVSPPVGLPFRGSLLSDFIPRLDPERETVEGELGVLGAAVAQQ